MRTNQCCLEYYLVDICLNKWVVSCTFGAKILSISVYLFLFFSGMLQKEEPVSWDVLVEFRNTLMLLVFLQGAPRAGVVSNMTLGQFRAAREVIEDDLQPHYVIKVFMTLSVDSM